MRIQFNFFFFWKEECYATCLKRRQLFSHTYVFLLLSVVSIILCLKTRGSWKHSIYTNQTTFSGFESQPAVVSKAVRESLNSFPASSCGNPPPTSVNDAIEATGDGSGTSSLPHQIRREWTRPVLSRRSPVRCKNSQDRCLQGTQKCQVSLNGYRWMVALYTWQSVASNSEVTCLHESARIIATSFLCQIFHSLSRVEQEVGRVGGGKSSSETNGWKSQQTEVDLRKCKRTFFWRQKEKHGWVTECL